MNIYEAVKHYLDLSPVPVTTPVVAAALKLDPDATAKALAALCQRPKPLIARREVSPERKTTKSMRFEYMSLVLAAELGVEVVGKSYYRKKEPARISVVPDHEPEVFATITGFKPNNAAENKPALPVIEDLPQPSSGIDALARLIGRRIARTMMEAMQDEIEEQLDRMSHELIEKWVDEKAAPMIHRNAPRPEKERLPKVLIAGLLPSQAGLITQEFGEVFDLRFYMTDDSLKKLRAMLPDVDHFITFTSKIEHAAEEHAKNLGIKIERCSGGMTMLRNTLTELYVNRKELT